MTPSAKFDQAWRQSRASGTEPPELGQFLPDATDAEFESELRRMIEIDQWYGRESGSPRSHESYLRQFPQYARTIGEALDMNTFDTPTDLPSLRCPSCRQPSLQIDSRAGEFVCKQPECGQSFTLQRNEEPPLAQVSDFELIGLLGEGGFGRVWFAKNAVTKEYVALKIPKKPLDRDLGQRFAREVLCEYQILSDKRADDRVPKLLASGRDGDIQYVAFEFVKAAPLSDRRLDYLSAPGMAARIGCEVARTLQIAHDNGIIHRDVKPSNILIAESNGFPYLTDFGIAKVFGDHWTADNVDATTEFIGTLRYASPEHQPNSSIDARSDIFSLGIVLYELLTGRHPFEGEDEFQTFLNIRDKSLEASPAKQTRAGIDPQLSDICARCLRKSREERFQSAGELDYALSRFLGEQPAPVSELENVKASMPASPGESSSESSRPPTNPPTAIWWWAIVPVLLLCTLLIWAYGDRDGKDVASGTEVIEGDNSKGNIGNANSVPDVERGEEITKPAQRDGKVPRYGERPEIPPKTSIKLEVAANETAESIHERLMQQAGSNTKEVRLTGLGIAKDDYNTVFEGIQAPLEVVYIEIPNDVTPNLEEEHLVFAHRVITIVETHLHRELPTMKCTIVKFVDARRDTALTTIWCSRTNGPAIASWIKEFDVKRDSVGSMEFTVMDIGADEIKLMGEMPNLIRLIFASARIEGNLPKIPTPSSLRWLSLSQTGVTDAGIAKLLKGDDFPSKSIERLELTKEGEGVTLRDVTIFKNLEKLNYLNVARTSVETESAVWLCENIKTLKDLHLSETQVDDRVVNSIKSLPVLENLYLQETNVTPKGAAQLKQSAFKTFSYEPPSGSSVSAVISGVHSKDWKPWVRTGATLNSPELRMALIDEVLAITDPEATKDRRWSSLLRALGPEAIREFAERLAGLDSLAPGHPAERVFGQIGAPALPALAKLLTNQSPDVRSRAARVLSVAVRRVEEFEHLKHERPAGWRECGQAVSEAIDAAGANETAKQELLKAGELFSD